MKKASMILGIIGGSISILGCIFFFVMSQTHFHNPFPMAGAPRALFHGFFMLFYVFAAISGIGGLLGIAGGILVKRKSFLAGIFLSVAAFTSFFNWFSFISGILLIIAAVFTFIKDKPAAPGPYAQQPYHQQPQYYYYQQPQQPQQPPQPQQPQQPQDKN